MKRTTLSVLLMFFASLALAAFLTAQQPAASGQQPDTGSQPASQSQSDPAQQAQPAQSTSDDQQGSAQSSDQSKPEQPSQSDTDKRMPKTASNLPLIALLGLTSLGMGVAAHRYSRRCSER
jgi:hypothetical protein